MASMISQAKSINMTNLEKVMIVQVTRFVKKIYQEFFTNGKQRQTTQSKMGILWKSKSSCQQTYEKVPKFITSWMNANESTHNLYQTGGKKQ